jgi:HprK-related kinase B
VYGHQRIEEEMVLKSFLILNWSHETEDPMQLSEVDIQKRTDLLPAIMKSPGPFYQFSDGGLYQDTMQLEEQAYIDSLQGVSILEVSGRVDIPGLKQEIYRWLKSHG